MKHLMPLVMGSALFLAACQGPKSPVVSPCGGSPLYGLGIMSCGPAKLPITQPQASPSPQS